MQLGAGAKFNGRIRRNQRSTDQAQGRHSESAWQVRDNPAIPSIILISHSASKRQKLRQQLLWPSQLPKSLSSPNLMGSAKTGRPNFKRNLLHLSHLLARGHPIVLSDFAEHRAVVPTMLAITDPRTTTIKIQRLLFTMQALNSLMRTSVRVMAS
jgi:hypothetical protein